MKKYMIEREGQIDFFKNYRIDIEKEPVLIDYTDGVYNGNIFEFKLQIDNLNKVLFQAIKYLSRERIRGNSVPRTILLISLNTSTCYVYDSLDYYDDIHKIYVGAASMNNDSFVAKPYKYKLDYSQEIESNQLLHILKDEKSMEQKYLEIEINEDCIVGWASRFYSEHPKASKGDFIGSNEGLVPIVGEIREPYFFKGLIKPYSKPTNEKFKYLMDVLNDRIKRKDLGAFYTPIPYCEKVKELLEIAIKKVPKGNDYIILDRCAGTGNLESILDEEQLSHCIMSTYEYYEYKVLLERLGDKVRAIIPPTENNVHYSSGFVLNANALEKHYLNNEIIKQYVDNPKCSIILFENPPYAETTSIEHQKSNASISSSSSWKESYVVSEMRKEIKGSTVNDIANAFIWSGFKYYLRQETDSYIVFSPVKYWKSQHLIDKKFEKGFAFNRRHFHTKIDACIMVALWQNIDNNNEQLILEAYDIENDMLKYEGNLEVKKLHSLYSEKYYDKRSFEEDINDGILTDLNGYEVNGNLKCRLTPIYNENIIGYLVADGAGFDNPDLHSSLLVAGRYNGNGFFLRDDNYLQKLLMFSASRYITYNRHWTERARIMKSADGSSKLENDIKSGKLDNFLLQNLLFCCFEMQNHMCSFKGTDGRIYLNQICMDTGTLASEEIKKLNFNSDEKEMLEIWNKVLDEAKKTKNYDILKKYGLYQINKELNTFTIIENNNEKIKVYDYPELNGNIEVLKNKAKQYYNKVIVPILFKYELLK